MTMSDQNEKSIYLFLTEGSSDKEYHVHLRPKGSGWVVDYANGPRGRVGQSKPKTPEPLNLEDARTVFEALVKSKTKAGYTEDVKGVRFTNTEAGKAASGHVQQLPTSIDKATALRYNCDDSMSLQAKANGERRTVQVRDGVVRGINKLGLYVNIPETWTKEFLALGTATIDGEQVGETFHAFDLLHYGSDDLRSKGFKQRYERLEGLVAMTTGLIPSLQILKAEFSTAGKRAKLASIEASNQEGVVYKEVTAPYEGGRSSNVFKYKLLESSTCLVIRKNQQRSVELALLDSRGQPVSVGNVTIPENLAVPATNDLWEVQYLYFNPGGGFEQPVSIGPRNDILHAEAVFGQVSRLKPGVTMDADGNRVPTPIRAGSQHQAARVRP